MTRETILRCARLASVKADEIHSVLEKALAGADAQAALARQVRCMCVSLVSFSIAYRRKRHTVVRGTWEKVQEYC